VAIASIILQMDFYFFETSIWKMKNHFTFSKEMVPTAEGNSHRGLRKEVRQMAGAIQKVDLNQQYLCIEIL
jgi:hypothetical protein